MIKTNVKVRGSTNSTLNNYNINSYYSTRNHTQRRFQLDYNSKHNYINYLIRVMTILVNIIRYSW